MLVHSISKPSFWSQAFSNDSKTATGGRTGAKFIFFVYASYRWSLPVPVANLIRLANQGESGEASA